MKLPHWAIVGLSLAGVVVAWLMKAQASGNLTLPAVVMTLLTIFNGVIGVFCRSAFDETK